MTTYWRTHPPVHVALGQLLAAFRVTSSDAGSARPPTEAELRAIAEGMGRG